LQSIVQEANTGGDSFGSAWLSPTANRSTRFLTHAAFLTARRSSIDHRPASISVAFSLSASPWLRVRLFADPAIRQFANSPSALGFCLQETAQTFRI
jgi:hypothetical protein